MNRSSEIESYVELDSGKELLVKISASIDNDSIGNYEFQGQKCNHKGNLVVNDYLIEYEKDGLTPKELFELEFALEVDKDNLEQELIIALQEQENE